ncbi:MAG TPA: DUF6159 family protein [Dehalococcoidia bacterium]|nr:DUF6159 family protein [Dehalococcoidia bacterium]
MFIDRIYRGWLLTQTSARILWADKRLLLFTLLSTVCTVLATAIILAPVYGAMRSSDHLHSGFPLMRLFILYMTTSFISVFFNTALVAIVLERLNGGELGFEHGLWVAVDNIITILVLAAISATVGVLLRTIGRQLRFGGLLAVLLFGAAWEIATFLSVPVIVAEGGDPFSVLGRSIGLVHKVWGEEVSSNIGIGMISGLFALPAIVLGLRGFFSADHTQALACIGIAAVYLALLSLIVATLNQIVRAAVYYFAQTGQVPSGFDGATLRNAMSK